MLHHKCKYNVRLFRLAFYWVWAFESILELIQNWYWDMISK
jgi:hypothetical protein